jgi:hypothetical protein
MKAANTRIVGKTGSYPETGWEETNDDLFEADFSTA